MPNIIRTTLRCLIVGLLLVGFLSSCGGLKGQLVGVWTDGQSTMEFKEDSTVNFNTPLGSATGYWKEVDSTHIDLQFSGFLTQFSSGRYEIRIKDDMMTVISPGGGFQMKKFK